MSEDKEPVKPELCRHPKPKRLDELVELAEVHQTWELVVMLGNCVTGKLPKVHSEDCTLPQLSNCCMARPTPSRTVIQAGDPHCFL